MNEKLREALEDLATRIGIIWIELLNNVDVGEEIEKLHQVECDILALAATPGETPNELTRQTMTATETGQNVVTFENIESMFKELAHPAPADGALREILSKLWDAAVLYRLAWREQTTIGKQDRLEADIAIQHGKLSFLVCRYHGAGKPWGGLWRCEVCEKSGSPDWYELVKGGSHYTNSGNCSGRLVHVERRICPAPADGALREAMAIWLEEPVVNHLWGDWETGYRTARAEVREIIDATFTHKSSQIAKKEAVNGD